MTTTVSTEAADAERELDREACDALLALAGMPPIPDRAAGVHDNIREMRRLAALVREVVADDVEPAAIFDQMAMVRSS
jgi:hypothetical protein